MFVIYEYNFSELIDCLNSYYENKRQEYQIQAMIAYKQAYLTADFMSGGEMIDKEIYEIFPFWKKEEIMQLEKEKYMRMAQKYKAKVVNK